MIRSKFSIITSARCDDNGMLTSCVSDRGKGFYLTFSGNELLGVEGIEPKDLYARVLLCWSDGLSSMFVVLKGNKIYNIDNFKTTGKNKMVSYMITHAKLLSDFESINDIEVFSKL